ncbi:arylsulfatase [Parabacteroides sp. FAFU027]|uniref:arylsulfatase n=1 Tax=Parabacteroides sp. FAFU027 TaxID=2922715 RepID=UPI001FAF1DD4|nr:arylsulfatase [Parabacteroides sp. FAFU027]
MISKNKNIKLLASTLLLGGGVTQVTLAQHQPLQPFGGKIGKTLDESTQAWPEKNKAPRNAPNVVWILLDDVGFGASSAFGGLVETPHFEALANDGLRFTNFHTTGISSPTRAALLTGRNHHKVAMGHHAELQIGAPGYTGEIPLEAGLISEVFLENGYNTFALGKWHGIQPQQQSLNGPFNRYPTGRGFEHFYGFFGGSTDQWHPQLVDGINQVNIEPNAKHLNELLADKAIAYIANQKSTDPEKPFFVYYATGATHAPHHVAKEWSDKYKGKFDKGWDWYRQEAFKRQTDRGLLQKGTVLPPRQTGVKAWDSLSVNEKKVFARFMENYAGYLSYTDHEIGRVIDYLKDNDLYDNTLIFLIIGDNGGSKEGTYTGTVGLGQQEKALGNNIDLLLGQYNNIGTEKSNPNYPLGWSQACNTPFRYWKSDANSEGGTHNPLIVHWPKGIKEKGGIRTQYSHVSDVFPTTVELLGLNVPESINGYPQLPIQGTSFAYAVNDAKAPTRKSVQYYELHGGRSIYKEGWKASVYHPRNVFGEVGGTDPNFSPRPFSQDKWELYNLNEDWNEVNDLADKNPEKLKELQDLFDSEAKKNNVYPLHSYQEGLAAPVIKPQTVILEGTDQKIAVNIGKGAIKITATIETNGINSDGVIFADGGLLGGTSLYAQNGRIKYLLNDGLSEKLLVSTNTLKSGLNTITVEFTDSKTVVLSVNGEKVTQENITARAKYLNPISGEGLSVGKDLNSPVTKSYPWPFPFKGKVKKLTIDQVVK